MITNLLSLFIMLMTAMLAMAFYTLSERKFLGYAQFRKGPNKPSISALPVPVSDAAKLFSKEEKKMNITNPTNQNFAPTLMIILSLLLWPLFPHMNPSFILKFGLFYFLCITSMNVYCTFLAGWASTSKWSLLGAIRGVAQSISYEVSLALIMVSFILMLGDMCPSSISDHFSSPTMLMLPLTLIWTFSILAESHRAPFDFAEGESELVSGFNVEYKSTMFAFIFMAEYLNIIMMSMMTSILIFGVKSNTDLVIKTSIVAFAYIWMRTTFPRLRFDILMKILWLKILPVTLSLLILLMALNL